MASTKDRLIDSKSLGLGKLTELSLLTLEKHKLPVDSFPSQTQETTSTRMASDSWTTISVKHSSPWETSKSPISPGPGLWGDQLHFSSPHATQGPEDRKLRNQKEVMEAATSAKSLPHKPFVLGG